MNRYRKKCFIAYFIALFFASMMSKPLISFAWGDSTYLEGGQYGTFRSLYKLEDVNNGALAGKITFNSITDSSNGNEVNFVSALSTDANVHDYWQGNNITVTDGGEYYVRLYVHNNNPAGTAAVSTGTKVAISGIGQSITNKDSKQEVEVNGFIKSDNATPKEYWDYVRFNSDTPFHLEYVYGSAMIYNRGAVGTTNPISSADIAYATDEQLDVQVITGRPLSDDIVEKAGSENGTLIGFDALDGNVPGCYAYSSYITIRVKAVYDYEFATEVKVRKVGTKDWSESIDAEVGEQLEFLIEYRNNSEVEQPNVIIRDVLPSNLKYIEDTVECHIIENGQMQVATLSPDDDLFTCGVNIDSCAGGVSSTVSFTAEVVDTDLEYGSNTLVNWGQADVGSVTQVGYAVVEVQKSAYWAVMISLVVFIISTVFFIILVRKIIKLRKM